MAVEYYTPELTGQYFDPIQAGQTPGDFQQGWKSYYYTGEDAPAGGDVSTNRFLGPRVSFQNEFNQLGLDPNGTYGAAYQQPRGYSGDNTRARVLYQQQGNQWIPVSARATPKKDSTGNFLKAFIPAALAVAAPALMGAAGGGSGSAIGGTGISASAPGAATGTGLGALPGAGLSLAAPTAGATGAGLWAGGLGGALGGAAGAASGLSSIFDGLDSTMGPGNYSLSSAPNFASSGGNGLNMGDFLLGDGYQDVFTNLSSPTISDYGALEFSPAAAGGFMDDIGGNLGESLGTGSALSGTLLDEVRRRTQGGITPGMPREPRRGGLSQTLLDIARRGVGVRNANRGLDDTKGILEGLDAQIRSLQDMFGPNSAFAQQMRQTLERKDAAAGRRSQYGPREVELQGALAKEAARTAPSLASLFSQKANIQHQSNLMRNLRDNVVLEGIGGPVSNIAADLLGPTVENTIGGWLGNIFGG